MIVFCCCHFCNGQSGPETRRGYSFAELIRELKARGYDAGYSPLLEKQVPIVEMELSPGMTVDSMMHVWLAGLKVGYLLQEDQHKIILYFEGNANASIYKDFEGDVFNTSKEPLAGATVTIAGTNVSVSTNNNGHFRLPARSFTTAVVISHVGCETKVRTLSNKKRDSIVLQLAPEGLDQAVVQAYGKTSRRTSTGNIHVVNSADGFDVPSGSLQDALEGMVPGLFISEPNGTAGSAKSVSLGGMHSIQGNNEPLYVVDGVPLAADGFLTPIGSGTAQGPGGANSLNFIAPENIASIEVLKDASATSIYGSRASNGVILITLKTGKPGPMRISCNMNAGAEWVVHSSPLLSTTQFLQLRKEAVVNDQLAVGPGTVPENYSPWDSTRYTNFQHLSTGATANIWNAGLQVTGGGARSSYLLSGQLHRETMVFPGSTYDQRGSLYAYIHSQNENGKLQFNFSGMYSSEMNHLPAQDFSQFAILAPNAPAFTDTNGRSQWGTPPLSYVNIPALANNDYLGNVYTLFGHLQVNWKIGNHLSLEESLGYNGVLTNEQTSTRLAGQDPNSGPIGQVTLAHNQYTHLMTETMVRWTGNLGPGRLEGLLGVDYQQRNTEYNSLKSIGYPNDVSLNAGVGATSYVSMNNSVPYRYAALFGRAIYNVANKYFLTGSWRRDGSSRLGDQTPYGDFWAVSGSWVFSEEKFLGVDTAIMSLGKIRASYGTTGNEPNDDNQFMEVYINSLQTRGYQGQQGLQPFTLANQQLHWELNYREEFGLEMELLHRLLWFSAAISRSWTGDQVINTTVGPVAGINTVLMNQPGINVENRALEIELQVNRMRLGPVKWTSLLMLTVPRNKLAAWPGLENTSYSNVYTVGHSLTETKAFHWTGVDPKTGYYTFQTKKDNEAPVESDKVATGGLDPRYYAGWTNSFRVGNVQLDLLLDYRRQRGHNPLVLLADQNQPGAQGLLQLSNGPVEWLDHWRKDGDISRQQRVSTGWDSVAAARFNYYTASDAGSIDASYLRLRDVTLSWYLPGSVIKKWKLQGARIYVRGQNLLTVTKFPVTDPETQDPTVLPPMRVVVAGVHLSF